MKHDLEPLLSTLKSRLQAPEELIIRRLELSGAKVRHAAILYLGTLVDSEVVDRFVLQPLLSASFDTGIQMQSALERILPVSRMEQTQSVDQAVKALLDGEALLLIDGEQAMIHIAAQQIKSRSPKEPEAERTVRGAKEGLIEDLDLNIALIRRRLRTQDLRITRLRIGRRSGTPVAVCFLEGIANATLVKTVLERLHAIDVDVVEDSSLIESYLQQFPRSPFPQVRVSERPDTIARELGNGRVAIIVDGTPAALLAPATFWDLLVTESDYTYSPWVGSMFRLIRLASLVIGTTLPGLYISSISFHPELIPNRLSLSIAASREGMPFPAMTEMSGMLIVFEIFREATLRMPKSLGQTAGVVAGFILGQAAVAAGVISDVMVVVIALSAITLFVIPDFGLAMVMRLISVGSLLSSAVFGLFGLGLWAIVVTTHLASVQSFGVPFLSPVAPFRKGWWTDTFVRAPKWVDQRLGRGRRGSG